jgi:hypothetical protein
MGAGDDPGGNLGAYGEIGRERATTKHTRSPSLAAPGLVRPDGLIRWLGFRVSNVTMSAEGRSLRVDGLGVSLAWSPRTGRARIRTPTGSPKACRALLPIPIRCHHKHCGDKLITNQKPTHHFRSIPQYHSSRYICHPCRYHPHYSS